MGGIVEVVKPSIRLESDEDLGQITGEQSVIEFDVQRSFQAGGSTATVDVVFTDGFDPENFEKLSNMVREAREYSGDGSSPSHHISDHPLDMKIDMQVTEPAVEVDVPSGDGDNFHDEYRIFTGHVTKVTETHEGIVTFEAMDARYYLNKNMVTLDVGDGGEYVDDIVRLLLTGDQSGGIGIDESELEETMDILSPIKVNRQWGVEHNITLFEVLDDLRMMQDAWFYIDNMNRIHFRSVPVSKHRWGFGQNYTLGDQHVYALERRRNVEELPPIIEWESGDEESEKNVVVESAYDEAGLGPYTWVSEETFEESSVSDEISEKRTNPNVYSRAALEKERDFMMREEQLMADSGTLTLTGDPRLEPHDEIELTEELVSDFSPISTGTYTVQEVRHILSSSEGFITEVDIGKNTQELYEQFVSDYDSENAAESNQAISGDGEVTDERGIWDYIRATARATLSGQYNP